MDGAAECAERLESAVPLAACWISSFNLYLFYLIYTSYNPPRRPRAFRRTPSDIIFLTVLEGFHSPPATLSGLVCSLLALLLAAFRFSFFDVVVLSPFGASADRL